ncbi:MAG: PAS domain S-box protein [Nitrospirae bacterium]|nr:PAS domain S-box protein [Nitrospirota bacterium]
MKDHTAYKIKSAKSSLRNNIMISFFIVLAFSGIIINIIFLNVIQTTLTKEGLDVHVIESISRHVTITGTGVTIAGILIVLFIAMFISETITRPIKKLTDGMIDIAEGKWSTRIEVNTQDELGQLAEGFNFMIEHVEEAVQKLKTSKEYTDNIVVSVPSILIVLNNRSNILSINKAFDKLSEQFPSISIEQLVKPLEEEIKTNLDTGESIKKEIVIVPEGADVRLIFSAVISRIGNGNVGHGDDKARVLLTITDITERKKMKELVMQSRQDWEDTFNMIPDMITIHDKDFNIIQANNAAQEMLGLPFLAPDRINKCFKYYHGTDSAPKGCPSCDCMNTGKSASFELFEPHLQKYIEIRAIARINANKELIGLIHIVRDISQRKKIEEERNNLLTAITKAKLEWEMTFDSAMEFIVLIDSELKITRCNKSFAEYVGKPANDLIGSYFYESIPCADYELEDCKDHMNSTKEMITEIKTKTGRWLHVSHQPIRDEKVESLHSVIIATDITDLKNAQQRIKESEEELKKKVGDLEKFYDMAIGRELRMKDLKKEIKKLNNELEQHKEGNGLVAR